MTKAPLHGHTHPSSHSSTTTTSKPTQPPPSSKVSYLPPLFIQKVMIRLWPSNMIDQLTPKAGVNGQERANPFDVPPSSPSPGNQTPTLYHHHLLNTHTQTHLQHISPSSSAGGGNTPDINLTPPPGPLTPSIGKFAAAALPTTHLSLHAPNFNMQQPPSPIRKALSSKPSAPSSSSPSTASAPPAAPPTGSSKGQIHVKLIQARGLNVPSIHGRPYVVVQFEQNEFVSRDPTDETDKEVKGTAKNLSPNGSSNALSALGAIGTKAALDIVKRRKGSGNSSPSSSVSSGQSTLAAPTPPAAGPSNGIFGRLSAHNPVWKHEVSLCASRPHWFSPADSNYCSSDVTSEESLITFNVYDRAVQGQGFLGTVQIKPVLVHDHTVDQWYK